jgi:hypothetical protein
LVHLQGSTVPPAVPDGSGGSEQPQIKRLKGSDSSVNPPSRTLHIRNLSPDVTEGDLVNLGVPFGTVVNVLQLKTKGQAFIQFADIGSSMAALQYYTAYPVRLPNRFRCLPFPKSNTCCSAA